MAIVIGGKHFGQYTYEHWFDEEYETETERIKKTRAGINPIGVCGRHCDYCPLGQWCGSCRSDYNCCSLGSQFENNICPNVDCAKNNNLNGCYECDKIDDCKIGYYGKNNEYMAKASALFIKKHGEECFSKALMHAIKAGEIYPKTFDNTGSVSGILEILEKYFKIKLL